MRKAIVLEAILVACAFLLISVQKEAGAGQTIQTATTVTGEDYIKWVDFNVSYEALCRAYEWDVDTYETSHHVNWIELLAYTAARTGGEFEKKALTILEETAEKLCEGETTIEELTKDMQYYSYYEEAYTAVLGGMVGEYEAEVEDENGNLNFQKKYGLKAYFPLARGFDYSHYDDFGVSRSYGYKRKHLGHDMMGLVGTPIIAIESGYVEALGWNQYGGWRVGIRSFDGKRYYYYAHLRQNYPFAEHLEEGSIVTAGDVIGYMGHTGYSTQENVNNIEVTHLHWGLELIFNEERREEGYEIWIDVYPLTRFLARHTQQTHKVEGTKEWIRSTQIVDPEVEKAKDDLKEAADNTPNIVK
uniref:M23 family metallopeptidase n=1 Tax=Acetatifactor sp. TaxID=1872090 RepID=UPI0040576DC6